MGKQARYRPLEFGEIMQIGDEYFTGSAWRELDENAFAEWCGCCTTYTDEMCNFRRSLTPDPAKVKRSQEILAEVERRYESLLLTALDRNG